MEHLLPPSSSSPRAAREFDVSPTLNATSAVKKSGISITLPRNFAPLSTDPSEAPRTPDQTFAQLDLPPPPPHSTFRIRRPRIGLDSFASRNAGLPATLFASEIPIPSSAGPLASAFAMHNDLQSDDIMPSVEVASTPTRPQLQQSYSEPLDSNRLRLMTSMPVPHTPEGQMTRTPAEIKREEWDMHRASSVRSHGSDSSLSTTETNETRPTSYDGSSTGAENELADPFSPIEHIKVIPATPQRKNKKLRLTSFFGKNSAEWTIDMDNHLFNVYQIYLADPTVTPFKTVPGSIPPTGVCHRVARRAKETWPRASRIDYPIIQRHKVRSMLDVRMTPRAKTPDPDDFLSTSHTDHRRMWPSESATRKRLKQLCREKFTISAHYNRMRESRSPSPFAEQFLPKRPSPLSTSPVQNNADAYTTRELHINLVASGATEPLAQLTTGDSPPAESALESFNQGIDNMEENQMSTSPPPGLGIQERPLAVDDSKLAPASSIPRLASPFTYNTWNGPIRPENHHRRHVSQNHFDTMHVTRPRLLSPFQPDGELALNVNKRRAQHNLEDELSPNGSSLAGHTSNLNLGEPPLLCMDVEPSKELVFTGLGDISQRRVRLRNRGATLGSAHERIARIFAQPTADQDKGIPPVPAAPSHFSSSSKPQQSTSLLPPRADEGQRRLGSPFELDPNKRSFRHKPRHLPSLSDPFIQFTHGGPTALATAYQNSNIGNIGDRLASFQQSLDDYKTPHP